MMHGEEEGEGEDEEKERPEPDEARPAEYHVTACLSRVYLLINLVFIYRLTSWYSCVYFLILHHCHLSLSVCMLTRLLFT